MSNNITKFLNSRNEVRLSSEKIELGLSDDLKVASSKYKELNKSVPKYIEEAKKVASTISDIKGFTSQFETMLDSNLDVTMKFRSAARELGIDPLMNADYKEMKSDEKTLSSSIKELSNLIGRYK